MRGDAKRVAILPPNVQGNLRRRDAPPNSGAIKLTPIFFRGWNSVTKALKLLVLVAALGSLTLAGCGRRGSLDRPSPAPAIAADPATADQAEPEAPRKRDAPFILDAII